MIAVVQRVTRALVRVDAEVVGQIDRGLLILVAVLQGDGPAEARRLAVRIAECRCFPDERGRMNLDLRAVGGQALVVSQFTLAADNHKGRRPSFDRAASPAIAAERIAEFVRALEEHDVPCASGRFGAAMAVELVNDGPVTLWFEQRPGGAS